MIAASASCQLSSAALGDASSFIATRDGFLYYLSLPSPFGVERLGDAVMHDIILLRGK